MRVENGLIIGSAALGKTFVGVDVGGTKVAVGLVDENGKILRRERTAMPATGDAQQGLKAVLSAIDSLLAHDPGTRTSISGIGICAPGPLDPKTGIVLNPPNLKCWHNFPLAEEMRKIYGVNVRVDNDGNAAALAEARWGAARGYRNVFSTGIGTGIGTGIVFDGQIYHGRTGAAGEGGHMSVDYKGPPCNCGKPGCIEILAAGPAIARRARAKLATATTPSEMLKLAHGDVSAVSSEMVGQAFLAGDAIARDVLLETIDLLALWLSNIVDLLDPEVIVIGGGAGAMLIPLFDRMHSQLQHFAVNPRANEVPLLPAQYGADAGIAGGAALCSS